MEAEISIVEKEIKEARISGEADLEAFRLRLLSRKGLVPALFDAFKQIPSDQKKIFGSRLNEIKNKAEQVYNDAKVALQSGKGNAYTDSSDYTLSDKSFPAGSRHPLSIVMEEIQHIFIRAGFSLAEGPEIEDDWHNFSALNFPDNHPARDMQDTFFITEDLSLRTHTSSVQVRAMESLSLPVRIIAPGRVYRNEAVSARANAFFHQLEAMYIDERVSMADLKQLLNYFAREFFGGNPEIRLRPSYFPFTEPSAEMDVSCFLCKGKGCNVCKNTGWLEVMGCGMIDPAVLRSNGIDPEKFSGYALGMGIERITMLKYNIKDLRTFFENDVRFLEQFKAFG
jgi:phenylalanyl-tRNA synthetase alpha chain